VLDALVDDPDREKILKQLEAQQFKKISPPSALPVGIADPLLAVLSSCKSEFVAVEIAQSISKTQIDKLAKVGPLIENVLSTVTCWEHAQDGDKRICLTIASLFSLKVTGTYNSNFEYQRWRKLTSGWIAKLFRTERDEARAFLAAWGIVYAIKYHRIIKIIGEHNPLFLNNSHTTQGLVTQVGGSLLKSAGEEPPEMMVMDISANSMVEIQSLLLPQLNDVEKQLELYLKTVTEQGRTKAYEQFLAI